MGIPLEWNTFDTRCSDSKLNSIYKLCPFTNNPTLLAKKTYFCFNGNYSIYSFKKSEMTKPAASHNVFDQKQCLIYYNTLIFVYKCSKSTITTTQLLIILHKSKHFVQTAVGHCWYDCARIENTWIKFHLLSRKIFMCAFLQIYHIMFIFMTTFYDHLHGQCVC